MTEQCQVAYVVIAGAHDNHQDPLFTFKVDFSAVCKEHRAHISQPLKAVLEKHILRATGAEIALQAHFHSSGCIMFTATQPTPEVLSALQTVDDNELKTLFPAALFKPGPTGKLLTVITDETVATASSMAKCAINMSNVTHEANVENLVTSGSLFYCGSIEVLADQTIVRNINM